MPSPSFYSALAQSIQAGAPQADLIVERASRSLGRNWRWLRPMARRYLAAFPLQSHPRRREIITFLHNDAGLREASQKYGDKLRIAEWIREPHGMQPADAAASWKVPPITTAGELADWLNVSASELDWFECRKRHAKELDAQPVAAKTGHYHYKVLSKNNGSLRLIEAPKQRLKEIQRKILKGILEKIPSHEAVHGFRKGRSVQTFATPHVHRNVVLKMDLQDFFPSISGARIQALFRTVGYPEAVAGLLSGFCTNAAPRNLWSKLESDLAYGLDPAVIRNARDLYSMPHLPQGAPTSPALGNLCAYRVDCRLSGLAKAAGATYTRYADDLAFSGDEHFAGRVERFSIHAAAILMEERFTLHHRKTRIMRQGVRQYLAGLVTNQRINIVRGDFDRLKAILTNCVRHGAISQNRENHCDFRGHLAGRVGYLEQVNAVKGARLRQIFNAIQW